MSGGILALALAAVIALPLLCCVGLCLMGGAGAVLDPTPYPTGTP